MPANTLARDLAAVGRHIPIIADDTPIRKRLGRVKITPAHDFNDFESASGTTAAVNVLM